MSIESISPDRGCGIRRRVDRRKVCHVTSRKNAVMVVYHNYISTLARVSNNMPFASLRTIKKKESDQTRAIKVYFLTVLDGPKRRLKWNSDKNPFLSYFSRNTRNHSIISIPPWTILSGLTIPNVRGGQETNVRSQNRHRKWKKMMEFF